MDRKPLISIVICTFNRLESLVRLIDGCCTNASCSGLDFEIVVSDNSPTGYAQKTVCDIAAQQPRVRYVSAHPANISVARNAGIKAARAEIIVFVDDDALLDEGWLDKMYVTLQKSGADCVLSAIYAKTEKKPPDWDLETKQFVRKWGMPDATLIPLTQAGKSPIVVSTNASMWKRASCFKTETPFNPAFGLCGGEDLELFLRLLKDKITLAWCGSARCCEWVPAHRMQFNYLFLRAFSGGQVFTAAVIHNVENKLFKTLQLMGVGVLQCLAGTGVALLLLPGYFLRGGKLTAPLAALLLKLAGAAGKCLWFLKVPLYQIENKNLKR